MSANRLAVSPGIGLAEPVVMLPLLPLLVAALQMQGPLTRAEVEQALADGVREKLAQGWSLADVSGDEDEVTLTLTHGKQVERHVVHVGDDGPDDEGGNAYRIDVGGTFPTRTTPDEFFALALANGGGIEIIGDCGSYYTRAYFLEAHAKGKRAASALVAATLKSADDIEGAYVSGGEAEFSLEVSGNAARLIVTLDDNDRVTAAEVRRYEYNADNSTYAQLDRMKRKLGDKVTSIVDGISGPKLVGDKRFELDTSAIESNHPNDGCGC